MNDIIPHRNLYTRLKPSKHGLGVFALRNIPESFCLFEGDAGAVVRVPRTVVDAIEDDEVRCMYLDFCPTKDGNFIAPADFNQLTMSWYMNHSTNSNVRADENLQFMSCRAISVGEELTIDYATFSDHASLRIAQWNAG